MLDSSTVGTALRDAREMAGITRRAAARRIGVSAHVLRDWEHCNALPHLDHVARAARLYGEGTELELPARTPLTTAQRPGVLFVGDEQIVRDLALAATDPDREIADLLARYLSAVRRARGLGPNDEVALRADDLLALAAEVDVTSERLHHLLADALHLDRDRAAATRRALVVGALITLVASGAIPDSFVARSPRLADDATVPTTWTAVAPGRPGAEADDLSPFSTMSREQRPADSPTGASLVATSLTALLADPDAHLFSTTPPLGAREVSGGADGRLAEHASVTTPFSTGPSASRPHGTGYTSHPTVAAAAPHVARRAGQLFSPAGFSASGQSRTGPLPTGADRPELPGAAPST